MDSTELTTARRDPTPRRRFLRDTLAIGVLPLIPGSLEAEERESDRGTSPRLLPGCCAYSYGPDLKAGRMTMEDFIRKGVDLAVSAVDITVYWLKSTDPAYLASLRHLATRSAMPFSGAACGVNMAQGSEAGRARSLADAKKWVDATNELGASHLRVFAGEAPAGSSLQEAMHWTAEVLKPASEYAGKLGITLGVENDSGIADRADVLLEIIRGVDSPYAGINLDISNFATKSDEEQYREIEACIPFATHVHIRDRFESTKGPIDLDRVWKLFVKHNYEGYLSAEYEEEQAPATGVPKLVAKVRALCRKYSNA
jgi:sugar phosphate isomerase/epimerase